MSVRSLGVAVPTDVAGWIAAVCSVAIFIAGLWSLGVRDLRAIGVALCSAPVVHGSEVANASFLVFGLLSLAWQLVIWANAGTFPPTLAAKALSWVVFGGMILWLGEGAPALRATLMRR